jgi:CelD/BcsL family acetyltransferase involved in cellulose biosynthesis
MQAGASQFDDARGGWSALYASLPRRRFFHHPVYVDAALRSVLEHLKDRATVLEVPGLAALPLVPGSGEAEEVPGLRILEHPHHVAIDLQDGLLMPKGLDTTRRLLEGLDRAGRRGWDLLWIPRVPAESPLLQALRRIAPPHLLIREVTESKSVSLKGGYEGVKSRIRSKFLVNERRKMKRLSEMGRVEHQIHFPKERGDPAFLEFLRLEASGWKGQAASALIDSPKMRLFFELLLEGFGRESACRIDHLLLDGVSIASQFSLIADKTISLIKIGYDESKHQVGPGGLLLHETLRTAGTPKDGLEELSFVTGAKWNDSWGARAQGVFEIRLYNTTPLGRIAHRLAQLKIHAKRGVEWARRTGGRAAEAPSEAEPPKEEGAES